MKAPSQDCPFPNKVSRPPVVSKEEKSFKLRPHLGNNVLPLPLYTENSVHNLYPLHTKDLNTPQLQILGCKRWAIQPNIPRQKGISCPLPSNASLKPCIGFYRDFRLCAWSVIKIKRKTRLYRKFLCLECSFEGHFKIVA